MGILIGKDLEDEGWKGFLGWGESEVLGRKEIDGIDGRPFLGDRCKLR